MQRDRDVVRPQAPERVLVGAQLAEVEAVGIQVVQVAELARVGDLLEVLHARVVLEQVPDHQHAAGVARAAATARWASSTDCASGFSTRQCLPASRARAASAEWVGTGVATTTASSVGVGEQLIEVGGHASAGQRAAARSRAAASPSHAHASSQPGRAAKLRARFGPQ